MITVCPSLTFVPSATVQRRRVPATGASSFTPLSLVADEDAAAGLEVVGAADVAVFDTGAACAAAGAADVVDAEAAAAVFCVDAEETFSFTLTAYTVPFTVNVPLDEDTA